MEWLHQWHYWVVIILMMIGLYIVISRDNLVKKIMGLNIFQVSVIMFYVALGKVSGGTAPIITGKLTDDSHGGHGDAQSGHGADGAAHGAHHGSETAAHGAHHGSETAAHDVQEQVNHGAENTAGHGPDMICWDNECPEGMYGMFDSLAQTCECAYYSNPLPHVLMLTAIVVGVATTALGLALVVRIQEAYGTVEEDDILEMDREEAC